MRLDRSSVPGAISTPAISTPRDAIAPQHDAFLANEDEFDEIFARLRERGLTYWADPHRSEAGRIN